jgi:hypothetical protein
MEIQLPRNLEARQATLILDDGRRVDVSGSGHVYVSRSATQLGGEDYTLVLPSVEHVVTHCDASEDAYANGHMTIEVEHRH